MPRAQPACRSEWSSRAVFTPAFCAGGLFCGSVLLAIQQYSPASVVPIEGNLTTAFGMLAGVTVFLVFASMVGMIISALPILIGVKCLAAIGQWNLGTRHYAFWALTGGAAPAAAAFSMGFNVAEPAALAFMLTGAACAAIARRYVRWSPIVE